MLKSQLKVEWDRWRAAYPQMSSTLMSNVKGAPLSTDSTASEYVGGCRPGRLTGYQCKLTTFKIKFDEGLINKSLNSDWYPTMSAEEDPEQFSLENSFDLITKFASHFEVVQSRWQIIYLSYWCHGISRPGTPKHHPWSPATLASWIELRWQMQGTSPTVQKLIYITQEESWMKSCSAIYSVLMPI